MKRTVTRPAGALDGLGGGRRLAGRGAALRHRPDAWRPPLWLGLLVNWPAALLADGATAFYVFVYTMGLKRRTPSNIVIGGAAGCFPVLVGWAAVTGGVGWPAVVLFAVIFLWTPPHFWALAMRYKDDYAAAGVPMLPVVATPAVVARRIVWYSWAMVAASLLLLIWEPAGCTAWSPSWPAAGSCTEAHRLQAGSRPAVEAAADAAVPRSRSPT